jgi:hypothetical protein
MVLLSHYFMTRWCQPFFSFLEIGDDERKQERRSFTALFKNETSFLYDTLLLLSSACFDDTVMRLDDSFYVAVSSNDGFLAPTESASASYIHIVSGQNRLHARYGTILDGLEFNGHSSDGTGCYGH